MLPTQGVAIQLPVAISRKLASLSWMLAAKSKTSFTKSIPLGRPLTICPKSTCPVCRCAISSTSGRKVSKVLLDVYKRQVPERQCRPR